MASYPERDGHIQQLDGYISNGDASMAEFMANQICERQRNIRQLQLSGLPVGLQALVNKLTAEMVSYPERDEHIRQLGGYISNGDVSMAEFMANQICERQRNIRQLQLSGLPVGLQALVNKLTAEMASYPERDEHIQQLDGYISNGDASMAEFMANQICERQRNVNLFQN
ncbi:hypothetical protein [Proteus columbae]|uniref:hypothetical protein n=1 Tax=Proteus columbae TaxID=1987580 RepID=UPI00288AEA69|nr:hypothetical protein [Proteus columbae]